MRALLALFSLSLLEIRLKRPANKHAIQIVDIFLIVYSEVSFKDRDNKVSVMSAGPEARQPAASVRGALRESADDVARARPARADRARARREHARHQPVADHVIAARCVHLYT